jgi:hypothetical protein
MAFHLEIIGRFVSQGVGTYVGSSRNIFSGSKAVIPDGDGGYLSVIETGGTGPARTQANATQRPGAQIVGRSKNPITARALAVAAYNACGGENGLHNVVLSGVAYVRLSVRQEVTDIGEDTKGRARFAFNIDAEKKPS